MNYRTTKIASYMGYTVQAIINNLSPVFFIIYRESFGISYGELSWLVFINFISQLVIDGLAAMFAQHFERKPLIVFATVTAAIGLVLLGILPVTIGGFISLVIPTVIYAVGSGFIEVMISPIIDSIPSEKKASDMSLLHSFYCWGQLVVVLFSTLLLSAIGSVRWNIIPIIWAAVPIVNTILFTIAPIPSEPKAGDGEKKINIKILRILPFFLLMTLSGWSEIAVSQWASIFAEQSLSVSKNLGDILGPCVFAACMGVGRLLFGIFGHRMRIDRMLFYAAVTCFSSYILISLASLPIVAFTGFMLCGFSVSIMWPGVLSFASQNFGAGSTRIFALLALFGDLGCAVGPWVCGMCSDNLSGLFPSLDPLAFGILCASIAPFTMIFISRILSRKKTSTDE